MPLRTLREVLLDLRDLLVGGLTAAVLIYAIVAAADLLVRTAWPYD